MEVIMIKKFFKKLNSKKHDVGYSNYIRIEYGREYNFLIKNGLSEEQAIYAISNKITH
tara:strand:+ start:1011 stop:1184 length:174 start_codon:yes stop_codon:yes gene_type:complete